MKRGPKPMKKQDMSIHSRVMHITDRDVPERLGQAGS